VAIHLFGLRKLGVNLKPECEEGFAVCPGIENSDGFPFALGSARPSETSRQ
jgi:hypothetical protein